MRILLLAGTGGLADEGAVNASSKVCEGLSHEHETLCITASSVPKLIRRIRIFNPEIIHSIHGPSPRTFILLSLLRAVCPHASFFATLTLPTPGLFRMRAALMLFRFIRLLTQDPKSEEYFSKSGFQCQGVSHGVDTNRFRAVDPFPIPAQLDKVLRPDRKILLHVGHLKPVRGMDLLADLARSNKDWQVVMVGSKRFPGDPETVQMLNDAGCTIFQEFIENLPALYCRADAYAFPVTNPYGAIDMPLTVLEAMACNRPVICTPYKALPRFIPGGNGVYYFRSTEEASSHLARISNHDDTVNTRSVALEYSWDKILDRLTGIYRDSRKIVT